MVLCYPLLSRDHAHCVTLPFKVLYKKSPLESPENTITVCKRKMHGHEIKSRQILGLLEVFAFCCIFICFGDAAVVLSERSLSICQLYRILF